MKCLKVLIAAGGSGGHIFPAMALANAVKSCGRPCEIMFVGSDKALDKRIFDREGLNYRLLSANKLPYRASLAFFSFFVRLFFDIIRSIFIIISWRPHIVVGFGGYVSFPVICIARFFKIRTIVHEQNVVPGRANRTLFKFSDRIAITFDQTRKFLTREELNKAVLTGNPIRSDMLKGDRVSGVKSFGLDKDKFTVLIIGGSQGSHFLNKTFVQSVSLLDDTTRSSMQVIHLTGIKDYEPILRSYQRLGPFEHRVHSFVDRMEEAYNASDLVVTRAGASALFEIAFFARPMVLIPYPFAASHQTENARAFSSRGAAIEIDEKTLTPDLFKEVLSGLMNNTGLRKKLSDEAKLLSAPEASKKLADEVFNLGKT